MQPRLVVAVIAPHLPPEGQNLSTKQLLQCCPRFSLSNCTLASMTWHFERAGCAGLPGLLPLKLHRNEPWNDTSCYCRSCCTEES